MKRSKRDGRGHLLTIVAMSIFFCLLFSIAYSETTGASKAAILENPVEQNEIFQKTRREIRLKCYYHGEVRVFRVDRDISFYRLLSKLEIEYGMSVRMKYTDSEGDLVSIYSGDELEDTFVTMLDSQDTDVIKLYLENAEITSKTLFDGPSPLSKGRDKKHSSSSGEEVIPPTRIRDKPPPPSVINRLRQEDLIRMERQKRKEKKSAAAEQQASAAAAAASQHQQQTDGVSAGTQQSQQTAPTTVSTPSTAGTPTTISGSASNQKNGGVGGGGKSGGSTGLSTQSQLQMNAHDYAMKIIHPSATPSGNFVPLWAPILVFLAERVAYTFAFFISTAYFPRTWGDWFRAFTTVYKRHSHAISDDFSWSTQFQVLVGKLASVGITCHFLSLYRDCLPSEAPFSTNLSSSLLLFGAFYGILSATVRHVLFVRALAGRVGYFRVYLACVSPRAFRWMIARVLCLLCDEWIIHGFVLTAFLPRCGFLVAGIVAAILHRHVEHLDVFFIVVTSLLLLFVRFFASLNYAVAVIISFLWFLMGVLWSARFDLLFVLYFFRNLPCVLVARATYQQIHGTMCELRGKAQSTEKGKKENGGTGVTNGTTTTSGNDGKVCTCGAVHSASGHHDAPPPLCDDVQGPPAHSTAGSATSSVGSRKKKTK